MAVRQALPQRGQARPGGMAFEVAEEVSEALRVGRGEHRGDAYLLPVSLLHHKHLKSTSMLERINEEIRRRTRVIGIFPNEASCLRLIRALTVETHENWIEAIRDINMDLLKEHNKEEFRRLDSAA